MQAYSLRYVYTTNTDIRANNISDPFAYTVSTTVYRIWAAHGCISFSTLIGRFVYANAPIGESLLSHFFFGIEYFVGNSSCTRTKSVINTILKFHVSQLFVFDFSTVGRMHSLTPFFALYLPFYSSNLFCSVASMSFQDKLYNINDMQ